MITAPETAHLVARVSQIAMVARLPTLPAVDVLDFGLSEGQVVRPAIEVRGQALNLVLQGREFELPQAWRPLAGQTVALQVRLLPDGSAQLRPPVPVPSEGLPAPPAPSGSASAPGPPPMLADRLTQLLWRPAQLVGWLSLLQPGLLRARSAVPGPPVDPATLDALMPRMGQLDGSTLREAVERSGLFGERSLARAGDAPVPPDMKSLLRAWQATLGDDQIEIRMRIGEAIDDIEAAQLQAIEHPEGREQPLLLALGFADAPPLRLKIGRDDEDPSVPNPPWTVNVHSQSERWGELSLQTRVFTDGRIELTMWADREPVCALAREHAPRLAEQLGAAGLRLIGLQVILGMRPAAAGGLEPPAGQLLDLRA